MMRVLREGMRTGRTLTATSAPDVLAALEPMSPSATTLLIEDSSLARSSRFGGAGEALACSLASRWPRDEGEARTRYGSAGHAIEAAGDGALHVAEVLALHGGKIG